MSLPSDLNADVAEAVEAAGERVPPQARRATKSLFRQVTAEQYGFAAAALVAFLGVAVCGPRVRDMRRPRREKAGDRIRRTARNAAGDAQRRTRDLREEAERRIRQLGGGTLRR